MAAGNVSARRNMRKNVPNVYHPKERPWVQIENATTEELIAQISKCPSGALSYRLNKKDNK